MMDLILNEPELITRLEQLALERGIPPDKLLRLAVSKYLDDLGRQKIHDEAQAFKAMHAELCKRYFGRYVAIHEGQVVDDDDDTRKLYRRVREHYGAMPVLIRQVTKQSENELFFRSPRFSSSQHCKEI